MTSEIYNFYQLSTAKGFKIVHLNIRSLPKKIEQLRTILQSSSIDVITLSETWLHTKVDMQLVHIPGYVAYRQDRTVTPGQSKSRGGGLIVYFKDHLDICVLDSDSSSTKDLEIQWLRITHQNAKNILLANLYRPPAGKLNQAIKTLGKGLTSLKRQNEEVVILGDVDYANKKSLAFKKIQFFEKVNSLDQKICTTTRNTKSSSTLLDIIFTNMKHVKAAGTLDSFLSDHQPIFSLKKKDRCSEKDELDFEGRSYRHYNKQIFQEGLLDHDWTPFYSVVDPSQAWENMLDIIVVEADKISPIRKFQIKKSKPCWLTNELIEQMKDRDYFFRKAKKFSNEDDWNIAKFHRNQVNFNVRRAKADFIKDQLRNNYGNSTRFWRSIKQIMPNKKGANKNSNISLTNDDDEPIEGQYIAEYMNEFFASLGARDRPMPRMVDCPPKASDSSGRPIQIEDPSKFLFEPIVKEEVDTLIRKINISKSSGILQVSSRLLKDSFQALSDKLTHLFNLSIATAIFPAQWKKALVIPIPKTGDTKKAVNYRPISLLPLPGKMLEKLIHTQFSTYIEEIGFLSDNQFGFRKQRSTSHAISQLLNQIYSNMNKSIITAAVYIDFSKAFNSVQHSTLVNKLKQLDITQGTLNWLISYLEGREQRTLVNSTYSAYLPVPQGVPQGSVLGPLLYIIYSNDIIHRIKCSGYTFYADDIVLYSKKKCIIQAGLDLQSDLDRLADWCADNEIYMNINKTKVVFFGSKVKLNSAPLPELAVGGEVLQRAKTYTYLGLKLDEQLSLETHANSLIKRVSNKVYQLTKIRSFITKRAALLIYKNMILPILEYGDIFLHSASQAIRKKLQTLQNKALRCALHKDKYVRTNELHDEAKLLKLKDRRHMHMLLHIYQLTQMPDFRMWKAHQPTGVRTRSSKKKLLSLRKPTNEKYKRSITYQGPKLWNALPGSVQKVQSYYDFKSKIKSLFQTQTKDQHKNPKHNIRQKAAKKVQTGSPAVTKQTNK